MDELFEADVAIIFDSHLYRHELFESPEMLKGNIYHFHDSPDFETLVMSVFIIQGIISEMDHAFWLLIFIS
jgi:hypothetical protein